MDSIEIIGLAGGSTPDGTAPKRKGNWFPVILLVAALGVLLASLAPSVTEAPDLPSTTVPTTEFVTPTTAPSQPVQPPLPVVSPIPSTERELTEPMLGVETGSVFLVRSTRRNTLSLIDADSGLGVPLELAGTPVLVVENWLVLWDDDRGWVVNLDDPNPSRRELRVDAKVSPFVWQRDGLLFLSARVGPRYTVYSIPIGQWDQKAALVAEVPRFPTVESAIPRRFDLMSLPGTGVYGLDPEQGFELAHEGQLVAVSNDLALVNECDPSYHCVDTWYRRDDWSGLEYPTVEGYTHLRILTGGDYYLTSGRNGILLSRIDTGRVWDAHTLGLAFNDEALPVIPIGGGVAYQTATGEFHYYDLTMEQARVLPFDVDRSYELSLLLDAELGLVKATLDDG